MVSCLESAFRVKRHVHDHKKNSCPLLLVADHRFFKHMGRDEESTTLNYLVGTTCTSITPASPIHWHWTLPPPKCVSDRADWPCRRHLQKHVMGRGVQRVRRPDRSGEHALFRFLFVFKLGCCDFLRDTAFLPSDHHQEVSDSCGSRKNSFQHEGKSSGGERRLGCEEAARGNHRKLTLPRHRVTVSIFTFRETGSRFRSVNTGFLWKRHLIWKETA